MATIPIEVIVQDAEAPVVPGEDGTNNTETNITVPDTGAISSNGDTSSSASSIILPAILLILAIGSIVAILIHKYHKQKKDKTSKKEKLAATASGTIAILASTVLVGSLVIPATKAATSDITDGITPAEDKVSIVVTRDGGAAEASIESKATITSTGAFGYKVLLSMAENVETSNLYLDGDEASEHYIAATEDTALTDNTWGYALEGGSSYNAVPLLDSAVTVAQGDETVEDEALSIYYGVKVGNDLPAGTYSGGNVEYNLVSIIPSSISDLTYMQDFAKLSESDKASVLRSMAEGEQYTLKDSRDTKDYFISKLKDGNVWMTQNLDLDLKTDGSIVYDSTNTNLTVAGSGAYTDGYTVEDGVITWAPANATIKFTGTTVDGWVDSNTAPYSADPDDVYYYTSGSDADDIQYNSLAECVAADHTTEECKHYHAGNYYNWSVAVASNDSSSLTAQYDNAANSICPAGWRLPASRKDYSDLANFILDYDDILEEPIREDCGGTCNYYPYLPNGFNKISVNPLWLTRSGNLSYGQVDNLGSGGYYQLNTVYSDSSAYNTYFNSGFVTPGNYGSRNYGRSVRCLVE